MIENPQKGMKVVITDKGPWDGEEAMISEIYKSLIKVQLEDGSFQLYSDTELTEIKEEAEEAKEEEKMNSEGCRNFEVCDSVIVVDDMCAHHKEKGRVLKVFETPRLVEVEFKEGDIVLVSYNQLKKADEEQPSRNKTCLKDLRQDCKVAFLSKHLKWMVQGIAEVRLEADKAVDETLDYLSDSSTVLMKAAAVLSILGKTLAKVSESEKARDNLVVIVDRYLKIYGDTIDALANDKIFLQAIVEMQEELDISLKDLIEELQK